MGARRGGGRRVGGRPQPPPPPPTGKLFFLLFGGPFCYFFTMWGPFLTSWGAFFRLAPLRKLLRAPMAPPNRPSSEKMCFLIFPGKGRNAYTLAPPPLRTPIPTLQKEIRLIFCIARPQLNVNIGCRIGNIIIVSHKTMLI